MAFEYLFHYSLHLTYLKLGKRFAARCKDVTRTLRRQFTATDTRYQSMIEQFIQLLFRVSGAFDVNATLTFKCLIRSCPTVRLYQRHKIEREIEQATVKYNYERVKDNQKTVPRKWQQRMKCMRNSTVSDLHNT